LKFGDLKRKTFSKPFSKIFAEKELMSKWVVLFVVSSALEVGKERRIFDLRHFFIQFFFWQYFNIFCTLSLAPIISPLENPTH